MRDATGLRGVLCWGDEEGDDHRYGRGPACRRGRPLFRTSPDLPLVFTHDLLGANWSRETEREGVEKEAGIYWSRCIDCGTVQSNDVKEVIRAHHVLSGSKWGKLFRAREGAIEWGNRNTGNHEAAELAKQNRQRLDGLMPCVACGRPLARGGRSS